MNALELAADLESVGAYSDVAAMLRKQDADIRQLRIAPGARIAQACLVPVPRVEFELVEQLSLTERGADGFGSTGQGDHP